MNPDGMTPCGKLWFHAKADAENFIESKGMQSIKGPDFKLNGYYCFDCDGFHIGHTRKQ